MFRKPKANGSNFAELSDKNVMCFIGLTALHQPMRLVTHAVFSEKAFPYQSGHKTLMDWHEVHKG